MPGSGELVVILLILLIGVVGLPFWIYTLVDCVKNEPETGNERLIWILVIALVGLLGGIIYWFARRPQRIAMYGR